jgi:hypothetical protein
MGKPARDLFANRSAVVDALENTVVASSRTWLSAESGSRRVVPELVIEALRAVEERKMPRRPTWPWMSAARPYPGGRSRPNSASNVAYVALTARHPARGHR